MSYVSVFVTHHKILYFGLLLTFFSSLGQTFLISLFVSGMRNSACLSETGFAVIYSAATLAGATGLPFLGRLIDRTSLRPYTLLTCFGLLASSIIVAFSSNVWSLFVGLAGLRLTGQGLLSHIASTVIARSFTKIRGKALGIIGLGYPLGEAFFPILVAFLLHSVGWRIGWAILAGITAVFLLPLVSGLLRGGNFDISRLNTEQESKITVPHLTAKRLEILFDHRFYLLLPGALALPFILTGIFLFQVQLAETRGWSTAWIASGFLGFSATRVIFSLLSGPWIDRMGASRLFPIFMVPLMIGLIILAQSYSPWAIIIFLIAAGASQGLGGNIKTALWAEIYPVNHLGEIRSLVSTGMVFSTATSPVLMGYLLQLGCSYNQLLHGGAILVILSGFASFFGCRGATASNFPEGVAELVSNREKGKASA